MEIKALSRKLVAFFDGTEYLTGLVGEGNGVEIVCLAFCTAFDLVPHDILIKALAFYRISRAYITWIKNWLGDRPQNVVVNGRYQLVRSELAQLLRAELSSSAIKYLYQRWDRERKEFPWQDKHMTQRSGRY